MNNFREISYFSCSLCVCLNFHFPLISFSLNFIFKLRLYELTMHTRNMLSLDKTYSVPSLAYLKICWYRDIRLSSILGEAACV